MKRQELKDRLIGLADGINDQTTREVRRELKRLLDDLATESLEGQARESGLTATLAKGEYVVPTGNTARGGVQPPSGGTGVSSPTRVSPDSLSETIVPPWMKGGQIGIQPAFPEGPEMHFAVTGSDMEVDVMLVCTRAMEAAKPQSRQRIARYLADRFEVS